MSPHKVSNNPSGNFSIHRCDSWWIPSRFDVLPNDVRCLVSATITASRHVWRCPALLVTFGVTSLLRMSRLPPLLLEGEACGDHTEFKCDSRFQFPTFVSLSAVRPSGSRRSDRFDFSPLVFGCCCHKQNFQTRRHHNHLPQILPFRSDHMLLSE